jgi:hypothetical protein
MPSIAARVAPGCSPRGFMLGMTLERRPILYHRGNRQVRKTAGRGRPGSRSASSGVISPPRRSLRRRGASNRFEQDSPPTRPKPHRRQTPRPAPAAKASASTQAALASAKMKRRRAGARDRLARRFCSRREAALRTFALPRRARRAPQSDPADRSSREATVADQLPAGDLLDEPHRLVDRRQGAHRVGDANGLPSIGGILED